MEQHTTDRLEKLRRAVKDQPFDTLMVLQEQNRRYLSGFTAEDGQCEESAGALFLNPERQILATDSRYETQARQEASHFEVYCYREGLASCLPDIVGALNTQSLGFESFKVSCLEFNKFQEELNKAGLPVDLVSTENLVEGLRMIKEPGEIEAIKKSLSLAEAVFNNVLGVLAVGMLEKDLAWTIEKGIREAGAERIAFPPIVATGPNAALPHAVPGDRPVRPGEPILFDWGARLDGYCSDISRTLVLGKPDATFQKVYQVVADAQSMAVAGMKPGISSQAVDKIARDHIAAKGFKNYFGHALGHGVGLATHEKPGLSPIRPVDLEAGMITTVEPGIYIPGWGGVRLENMVLLTEDGALLLNRLPLQLLH